MGGLTPGSERVRAILCAASTSRLGIMTSLEQSFFEFCAKSPQGVTDKIFRAAHPDVAPGGLVDAINSLVSKGRLELFKGTEGLVYRAILHEELPLVAALEGDEKIVYQCIKASDNRGIWTRDLKTRTNLHQTVITKVLRLLESRKLIKAVKSVKNSTRKVYMLSHLEPSADITGGPWFSENELDTEFIEEMCKICYRYILSKSTTTKPGHILPPDVASYPDLEQVSWFIHESKVTSAALTAEDISMLLDRLVFDGQIEKVVRTTSVSSRIVSDDEDENAYVYKAIRSAIPESMMGSLPCGTCPVSHQCSDDGPVTPSKCEYYTQWLGF